MGDADKTVINVCGAITEIAAADWDACANPDPARYNPLVSHAFLKALEDANCVGAEAGWLPRHLALEDATGSISGCAPCYVKSHSQGEYIFDHAWADAYQRAGGHYYPKLQCAIPFTPVPGPRLLVRQGATEVATRKILAAGAVEIARRMDLSSLHLTFLEQQEWEALGTLGFLQRTDQQFHWHNDNYETFDDFLARLSSRKRKAIRKERMQANDDAFEIDEITGRDITEADWDDMFEFYIDTGNRKWGMPYLNREFFSLLGQSMAERCLLIFARRDGRNVAGALHLIGADCLYGRYWGASEHHPFLHFELCYYRAIDYAIRHRLSRVEAGAQGEHKLARGYTPVTTYSAHWIADPGLRNAISRYLASERHHVEREAEVLMSYTPYRKNSGADA